MIQIAGISSNVDGCGGLIALKAQKTYARLDSNSKRWIDLEDIQQEGCLLAFLAERDTYLSMRLSPRGAPVRTAKFSTWLYWLLERRFSNFVGQLKSAKRALPYPVLELDEPLPGYDDVTMADMLPGVDDSLSATVSVSESDNAGQFLLLCKRLPEAAVIVLIKGLLFSDARVIDAELCRSIGEEAAHLGITFGELAAVARSEKTRKKLLTRIAVGGMISEGAEESIRLLQCVECGGKFSIGSIRENRFFVEPMTCHTCYGDMQKAPSNVSCFGKLKSPDAEGYAATDAECIMHCRDRAACAKFSKEQVTMADKNAAAELEGEDFTEIDEKAEKGKKAKGSDKVAAESGKKKKKVEAPVVEEPKKKKKAVEAEEPVEEPKKKKKGDKAEDEKPAASAKPKKEKKAAAEEDDRGKPPNGVVEWPYRNHSAMDYIFRSMLAGVSKKAIKKEVEKNGNNWNGMYKIMARPNHAKHTWKLNEEGETYKIFDVKFLG